MSLRVGLIGLGEVAQLMHLPLLADDSRFSIAAVSDISPGLTQAMAQRYGAKSAETAREIFENPDIDAVFILTPDHLHAGLLAEAIRAGKHVFVEKPVCLNLDEFASLTALDIGTDKTVFVGYMRRYAPAFLALKENMPAPDAIRHVRIRDIIRESQFFVDQTRPVLRPTDIAPETVAEGRARTDALLRTAIGERAPRDAVRAYQLLTGLASHSISAMRELLGLPQRVAGARQHGGETVLIWFDYGHFTASYEAVISDVAQFDSGIEVLTQNQRFAITYDTPYVRHLPTRLEITTSGHRDTETRIVGPFYRDAFQSELDAFIDCIESGKRPKTGLQDSRHDLELFAEIGGMLNATPA